jgi:hypothetical protein
MIVSCRVLPCKGLKGGVCRVDPGTDANKTHQRIAVVAWKVLVRVALVKTLKCESHKLELAQNEVAFVVINELQ